MRFKLGISQAVSVFGAVAIIGLVVLISTSQYALNHLKVGGPVYDRIKLGNDLIADILPPPAYVIEAYLEATLALNDVSALQVHQDKLAKLRKEYDERREFWLKSPLDPTLKAVIVETSHAEAQKLWQGIEDEFLPALSRGDVTAAARHYADITKAYVAHRAIIDDSSGGPQRAIRRSKRRQPHRSAGSPWCSGRYPQPCCSSSWAAR